MAATTVTTTDAATALRLAINNHAGLIDTRQPYDQGPLSTIQAGGSWESSPGSPGVAGRTFLVTSGYAVPLLFRDTGTGWSPVTLPSFSAKPSTTQSIADNVLTKIVFGIEEWDDLGAFTPGSGASQSRFVPPTAGVWDFTGYVQTFDNIPDQSVIEIVLYKNGSSHRVLFYGAVATSGQVVGYGGSALATANGSTDYFELFMLQAAGISRSINVDSYFQGKLVRPA